MWTADKYRNGIIPVSQDTRLQLGGVEQGGILFSQKNCHLKTHSAIFGALYQRFALKRTIKYCFYPYFSCYRCKWNVGTVNSFPLLQLSIVTMTTYLVQ